MAVPSTNPDWMTKFFKIRKSGKSHMMTVDNLVLILKAALDPIRIVNFASGMPSSGNEIRDGFLSLDSSKMDPLIRPILGQRNEEFAVRYGNGSVENESEASNTEQGSMFLEPDGHIKLSVRSLRTIGAIFHVGLEDREDGNNNAWISNWKKARVQACGDKVISNGVVHDVADTNAAKLGLLAGLFGDSRSERRALGHLFNMRARLLKLQLDKEKDGQLAITAMADFNMELQEFDTKINQFRLSKNIAQGRTDINKMITSKNSFEQTRAIPGL